MFIILLLTDAGSVPSDPTRGTTFMRDLRAGKIYSDMLLKASFDFAAYDVFAYLALKSYDATGGKKLAGVNLTRWLVDAGRVEMEVEMLSADGDVIHYELPIRL